MFLLVKWQSKHLHFPETASHECTRSENLGLSSYTVCLSPSILEILIQNFHWYVNGVSLVNEKSFQRSGDVGWTFEGCRVAAVASLPVQVTSIMKDFILNMEKHRVKQVHI